MRRAAEWGRLCSAVGAVAVLSLAACAPAGGGAAPPAGAAHAAGTAVTGAAHADCTKATKVTIVQKAAAGGHVYAFSPSALTIQRGAFLAITNKSAQVHDLVSKPDAGIVTSVLDLRERQVVQFPVAGTFTVESAAAAHRATLRVTVSGESGCAAPAPTLRLTAANVFTPAKLSVAATANFTVVNASRSAQTVVCTPDPGSNRDNSRLDAGETQILAIDKPGRYACTSLQHRGAKVTITVNG